MPTLFSNIAKQFRKVYHKAEGFIEEEREFPISQVFLNATFKKFVTDNVQILEGLHADLHEDWLRLYATINVKGLHTILSVDLKLVQMELNKDMQLIVFEQISETEIIEAKFPNFMMKVGFKAALFFYQKILRKDPLGIILEKFEVVKVHVNHAELRETELVVIGNVNLMALFSKMNSARYETPVSETELDDQVTPIVQK